jgi:hypothetical protein
VADLSQLSRVEPVAPAIRALIDLDLPLWAEEVPMKLNPITPWTLAFAFQIDHDVLVTTNTKQGLSCRFILFIHPLQFEGIEPNAATAFLTDIDDQVADLHLR